jgi:hypothetical protein
LNGFWVASNCFKNKIDSKMISNSSKLSIKKVLVNNVWVFLISQKSALEEGLSIMWNDSVEWK